MKSFASLLMYVLVAGFSVSGLDMKLLPPPEVRNKINMLPNGDFLPVPAEDGQKALAGWSFFADTRGSASGSYDSGNRSIQIKTLNAESFGRWAPDANLFLIGYQRYIVGAVYQGSGRIYINGVSAQAKGAPMDWRRQEIAECDINFMALKLSNSQFPETLAGSFVSPKGKSEVRFCLDSQGKTEFICHEAFIFAVNTLFPVSVVAREGGYELEAYLTDKDLGVITPEQWEVSPAALKVTGAVFDSARRTWRVSVNCAQPYTGEVILKGTSGKSRYTAKFHIQQKEQ